MDIKRRIREGERRPDVIVVPPVRRPVQAPQPVRAPTAPVRVPVHA